ncbi:MAG TPA: AAA family ATPase [Candidatus Limnocylindrales bacterium]|nr:AAA family ATPase [Candidatus Limnocylindrales bacterium]
MDESAAFQGRQGELRSLDERLAEVTAGRRPGTVVILGEAGLGKTRLTSEFVARAVEERAALSVLRGRCPPGGTGSTYWPLAEALRTAAGLAIDADPRSGAEALRRHVGDLLGGGDPEALEEAVQVLALTAGLPLPDNPYARAEPRAVGTAIGHVWPRYVGAHARRGGAILLVEDLHWADPQLLSVLRAIHDRAGAGLLCLFTARPELATERPDFVAPAEGWSVLTPPPLAPAEAQALVRALVQAPRLPRAMADLVAGPAEGNPLHIEEAVRHVAARGALAALRKGFRAEALGRLGTLPGTIQELLRERIATLPPTERRVVEGAAIVGKTFWDGAVARASGLPAVAAELAALEGHGLVEHHPASAISGQEEWEFRHVLIREAAYDSLLPGRRARGHVALADWLEERAGGRVSELSEFVAEHLRRGLEEGDRAGIWETHPDERELVRARAFRRLVAAGDEARQSYAIDHAVEIHSQSLALATGDSERAEALDELGEDHEMGLRGEEAMAAYREALAVARGPGVAVERRAGICMKAARTLSLRWGAFAKRPGPEEMDALVDEGLAVTRDPATRCWLLALSGLIAAHWQGAVRPDPVPLDLRMRRARQALAAAPDIGLVDLAGLAARILGQLEFEAGRFEASAATTRAILPLLDRMDSKFQRALTATYVFLSLTDAEGRYIEALPLADRALGWARELSPHEHMHGTFMALSARHSLGLWQDIDALLEEALEAMRGEEEMVCPYVRGGPMTAALTYALLGQRERAEAVLERIKLTWDEPGLPEMLAARVATANGDPRTGLELCERILSRGRAPSMEENGFDHVGRIEALIALEDWEALGPAVEAARPWAGGLAILGPICDRAEALRAWYGGATDGGAAAGGTALGQDASGEDAVVAALRGAATTFQRMGVRHEAAKTMARLAAIRPDDPGLLLEAVETAEPLLSPRADHLPAQPRPTSPTIAGGPLLPLSDREREVLVHVARGLTNDKIARTLVLSPRTVERHLSNIYAKLGLEGKAARAAAAAIAARSGSLDPEDPAAEAPA